jgi:hypothetical protein
VSDIVGTASVALDADAAGLAQSIADELQSQVAPALRDVLSVLTQMETGFSSINTEAEELSSTLDAVQVPDLSAESNIPEVTAEVEQLSAAIASVPDVDIDADASGLRDTAAAADETSAALSNIGTQAEAAGDGISTVGINADAASTKLLAGAAAVSGFGFGIGALVDNSLDAESNLQSFNARVGEAAEQIDRIDIGGLNTDIESLAVSLGSSDEELRSVAARLFQLGESEDFAVNRSDRLIEQVVVLAARARALNPELGSVGSIADSLATRLQRGGRFVTDFGISLNTAEIQARALQNSGKQLATELTFLEKTEAAAQIATERLGGSLTGDIALGADNARITLDRLRTTIGEALEPVGAPLVDSLSEIVEEATPLLVDLGETLAIAGEVAASVLIPALQIAAPILGTVVGLLDAIPTPVLAAVAAFLAFRRISPVLQGLAENLQSVSQAAKFSQALGSTSAGAAALGRGAGAAAGAVSGLNVALQVLGPALVIGAAEFAAAEARREKFEAGVDSLASAIQEAGDPIAAFAARTTEAITSNADFANSLADAGVSAQEFIDGITGNEADFEALRAQLVATEEGLAAGALGGSLDSIRNQFFLASEAAESMDDTLGDLDTNTAGAADSTGELTDALRDELDAVQSLDDALADAATATVSWADAQDIADQREEQVRAGIEGQIAALEDQKKALQSQGQAVEEFNKLQQEQYDQLVALEQQAQAAFSAITQDADAFASALADASALANERAEEVASAAETLGDSFTDLPAEADASLADFRTVITTNLADTAAFIADIQELLARGADDLASFLLQQGEGAAGAADEAAALNADQLAEQEAFIEESEAKNQAQISLVQSLVDELDGIEPPAPIPITFDTEGATAALDAQIAALREQAASLDFTATLADLETAQATRLDESARFFEALGALQDRGAEDLAAFFAEQGIESLAAAEEAAALDKDELKRREAFIDSVAAQQKKLLNEASEFSVAFATRGKAAGEGFLEELLAELDLAGPAVAAELEALLGFGFDLSDPKQLKVFIDILRGEGGAGIAPAQHGEIITSEGVRRVGEGGLAEVIIPLTDETRARELAHESGLDRILADAALPAATTTAGRSVVIENVSIVVPMPPGATRDDGRAFGEGISEGFMRRIEAEIGVG